MKITVVGAVVAIALVMAGCWLVDVLLGALTKGRGDDPQRSGVKG